MAAPTTGKLQLRIKPNKRMMEIMISTDNQARIAGVELKADQVEELIVELGGFRAEMIPQVPLNYPDTPSHRVNTATNYRFSLDPFSGTPLLSFRNPGLGWVTFPLGEEELQRMVRSLPEAKARLAKPHSDTKQ